MRVGIVCAFVATTACGHSEPLTDAGSDASADVYDVPDAAKCTVPEADGALPTYQWSFNQQTILENNGLIPTPPGSVVGNHFEVYSDLGCGAYLMVTTQQPLGNLEPFPPVPQRWRLSAWFRGKTDGTVFDFEGIRLTITSGMLSVARTGATPPSYSTTLNPGDGAWHAIALQVDATTTPLSIQVFVDSAQHQSPSLSWTADLTSTDLYVGGQVEPTTENDFDEVSFFLYP